MMWERGPGDEAGRAGFGSCRTLNAGIRHLDFTRSVVEATGQS